MSFSFGIKNGILNIENRFKEKNMDTKKAGAFLKALRKESGYTQNSLAEKLSVSNKTISRWERGVNMPDLDILIVLSHMYNVSIHELINGERESSEIPMESMERKELLEDVTRYSQSKEKSFKIQFFVTLLLGILAMVSTYILGYKCIEQINGGYIVLVLELTCFILLLVAVCLKRMVTRFDVIMELLALALGSLINNMVFCLLFFPSGTYINQGLLGGYLMIAVLVVGVVFIINVIKILVGVFKNISLRKNKRGGY